MASLDTLTGRQREVYDFIAGHIRSTGHPPSVREMAAAMKFANPSGVTCHLQALKKKGLIEWTPLLARSIRLTVGRVCPCCGRAMRKGAKADEG